MKKVNLKYHVLSGFLPTAYLETALSAGILAYAVGVSSGFDSALPYAFFLFFATLSMYNLLRGVSLTRALQNLSFGTLVNIVHIPIHFVFSGICGLIALIFLLFLSFDLSVLLLLGLLFIITILYRFKWLLINGFRVSLSDLPFIKAFLVAFTWTMLTVFVPMQNNQINIGMLVASFFFFLALSIPFDVKDIQFDPRSRKTFPQVFGVRNALILSAVIHLIASVVLFLSVDEVSWFWLTFVNLFFLFLINRINISNFQLLYFRLLDITPLLWALMIF